MKRIIVLYALALALLLGLLKFLEYRYFVKQLSVELYMAVIATLFTGLGIWLGLQLLRSKRKPETGQAKPSIDQEKIKELQISPREYEVLQLINKGYSNQEIADSLFVSLSTIKTHSSNLFVKLNVKRRTQAIQTAKELNLVE
jgi:ATP/maltotriose-dependent transcriptional regulator MalT